MKPRKHQLEISKQALPILKNYGLVCLSMQERTGKTLISLLLAEEVKAEEVLIITKKAALEGWQEHLDKFKTTKNYKLVNYHQVVKINPKYKPDLVIIDECHAYLSGFPKPGKILKEVRSICYQAPAIFLSATFSAQSFSQLFHEFCITKFSPWNHYKSFYRWFEDWGLPYSVQITGRTIKKYDRTKPGLYESVEHLFISYTRKELGFEHEPSDVLHYIELDGDNKVIYQELRTDYISGQIVADSPMKLMMVLHQLEGGVVLNNTDFGRQVLYFGTEKFDYFIKRFGDKKSVVVMAHYVEEQKWLKSKLKKATVLSSTAYAEGVDLSMYKTLVIYSQGFSTAQHRQRRARQANMKRKEPIAVHFLLMRGGVSEAVYRTVSINGKNFVDRYYQPRKRRVTKLKT